MDGEKKVGRAFLIAGIFLILLQIGVYGVFGSCKQGYFIDEIFSYGLSNSYDKPFLSTDLAYDEWVDQSYFTDYVTVQPEHRFAYGSVYANQEADVHPPLFYFLLHTICSFFPGTFSKWYGLSLNAACLVAASLLLLHTGAKVLRDRWLALIVCAAFVLNPVVISCFLFVRMYALFLLLATAYFCLHWKNYQNMLRIKTLILLSVNVFLGFMTHYYFLVLAFAIAAVYVPLLLLKKQWKAAAFYSLSLFAGIAAGCLFFPKCIYHIFSGYRGVEAFGQWDAFWGYLEASGFRSGIVWNLLLLAAVILLLAFAIRYLVRQNAKRQLHSRARVTPVMALMTSFTVSTALYIGIVSVVAPYDEMRYYFCLFGYGFILLAYFVMEIITHWMKSKAVARTVIAVLFAAVSALLFIFEPVDYLYPEQNYYTRTITTYSDCSCIYVIGESTGTWPIHEEAMRLSEFGSVYFVEPEDLYESMQDLTMKHALSKQCVLYLNLWNYYDVDFEEILKVSDYSHYSYLYVTEHSCVMLFE